MKKKTRKNTRKTSTHNIYFCDENENAKREKSEYEWQIQLHWVGLVLTAFWWWCCCCCCRPLIFRLFRHHPWSLLCWHISSARYVWLNIFICMYMMVGMCEWNVVKMVKCRKEKNGNFELISGIFIIFN